MKCEDESSARSVITYPAVHRNFHRASCSRTVPKCEADVLLCVHFVANRADRRAWVFKGLKKLGHDQKIKVSGLQVYPVQRVL